MHYYSSGRYKAGIRPFGAKGFSATDGCPVAPKMTGMEIWSEPLFQVDLTAIRLISEKSGTMTCGK